MKMLPLPGHKCLVIALLCFMLYPHLSDAQSPGFWTRMPYSPGSNGHYSPVSMMIGTKEYLGLGIDSTDFKKDFWEYDTQTGQWRRLADFPARHRAHAMGFAVGGKCYVGGGDDNMVYFSDFYEYDPQTDTWTQKQNIPGAPRSYSVGFAIGNKGYAGLGADDNVGYSDFYEYNPAINQWTTKAVFAGGARNAPYGFSIDSLGYVGGGLGNGGFGNDLWSYSPGTNQWTKKADLPGNGRWRACVFVLGHRAFLGTGYNNMCNCGPYLKDFWMYDAPSNTWTPQPDYPGVARESSFAFSDGTNGYVGGGGQAFMPFYNDLYKYTPAVPASGPKLSTPIGIQKILNTTLQTVTIRWLKSRDYAQADFQIYFNDAAGNAFGPAPLTPDSIIRDNRFVRAVYKVANAASLRHGYARVQAIPKQGANYTVGDPNDEILLNDGVNSFAEIGIDPANPSVRKEYSLKKQTVDGIYDLDSVSADTPAVLQFNDFTAFIRGIDGTAFNFTITPYPNGDPVNVSTPINIYQLAYDRNADTMDIALGKTLQQPLFGSESVQIKQIGFAFRRTLDDTGGFVNKITPSLFIGIGKKVLSLSVEKIVGGTTTYKGNLDMSQSPVNLMKLAGSYFPALPAPDTSGTGFPALNFTSVNGTLLKESGKNNIYDFEADAGFRWPLTFFHPSDSMGINNIVLSTHYQKQDTSSEDPAAVLKISGDPYFKSAHLSLEPGDIFLHFIDESRVYGLELKRDTIAPFDLLGSALGFSINNNVADFLPTFRATAGDKIRLYKARHKDITDEEDIKEDEDNSFTPGYNLDHLDINVLNRNFHTRANLSLGSPKKFVLTAYCDAFGIGSFCSFTAPKQEEEASKGYGPKLIIQSDSDILRLQGGIIFFPKPGKDTTSFRFASEKIPVGDKRNKTNPPRALYDFSGNVTPVGKPSFAIGWNKQDGFKFKKYPCPPALKQELQSGVSLAKIIKNFITSPGSSCDGACAALADAVFEDSIHSEIKEFNVQLGTVVGNQISFTISGTLSLYVGNQEVPGFGLDSVNIQISMPTSFDDLDGLISSAFSGNNINSLLQNVVASRNKKAFAEFLVLLGVDKMGKKMACYAACKMKDELEDAAKDAAKQFVANLAGKSAAAIGAFLATLEAFGNADSLLSYTNQMQAALPPQVTGVVTNVDCAGNSTGTITLTITNGTPPYSFTWSDMHGMHFQNRTNLGAGNYTVTVKSNGANTGTDATFHITSPSPINITATTTPVNCFGDTTGTINLAVTGGTQKLRPPYTYVWADNHSTQQNRSHLRAGSYAVTVKDSLHCSATQTFHITQADSALQVSVSQQTNVTCKGAATGSVAQQATGGTRKKVHPYIFHWPDNSNLQSRTGLSAGSYTVNVTDSLGCTKSIRVSVTQPDSALSLSVLHQTNITCHGDSTGSVTLQATGGTRKKVHPYAFLWPDNSRLQSRSGLKAGSYTVNVTDSMGCTKNLMVNITQPDSALNLSVAHQTNVLCYGAATGSVTLLATGGTQKKIHHYVFHWPDNSTLQSRSGLTAGNYTVSVTDSLGCTKSLSFRITQPDSAFTVVVSHQTNVACRGAASGSVTLLATGGTRNQGHPYIFHWPDNSNLQNRNNLAAGTYVVTVKDSLNCMQSVTVVITQPDSALNVVALHQTPVTCRGGSNGSVALQASGGTRKKGLPYTFHWPDNSNLQIRNNLAAGVYLVSVKDSLHCEKDITVTITQPDSALKVVVGHQTNIDCRGNADGNVVLLATGGTRKAGHPYLFHWVDSSVVQNRSGLIAGTYTVTVTDSLGCMAPLTVTITQPDSALSARVITQYVAGTTSNTTTVLAHGGTKPYTYSWNTVPASYGSSVSNLAAGNYQVTVKDRNQCSLTLPVTIAPSNLIGQWKQIGDSTLSYNSFTSYNGTLIANADRPLELLKGKWQPFPSAGLGNTPFTCFGLQGDLYAGLPTGQIAKFHPTTKSWTILNTGITETTPSIPTMVAGSHAIFVSSAKHIYMSCDSGRSWHLSFLQSVVSGQCDFTVFNGVVIAANPSGFYECIHETCPGDVWKRVDNKNGLPDAKSLGMIFPVSGSLFVESFQLKSGYMTLLRSTDNGASWQPVAAPNVTSPIKSMVSSGNILFASCRAGGVYESDDNGLTWRETDAGLGNHNPVYQLIVLSGNLYAATQYGIYEVGL